MPWGRAVGCGHVGEATCHALSYFIQFYSMFQKLVAAHFVSYVLLVGYNPPFKNSGPDRVSTQAQTLCSHGQMGVTCDSQVQDVSVSKKAGTALASSFFFKGQKEGFPL